MAGRTVIEGRYELDELPIGHGGMGEVWGGYDQRLDRRVAVKFVRPPHGRPDQRATRRFVRESRITARMQHPGVPTVYDAGTHDGDLYLVMQLVDGISLADLIAEQGRLSIGWAAAIAAQICAVLAAAHARSLIHRDLKPTNVMVGADGVKVLDFGLAAALEPGDFSRITSSDETLGTPAYMAPEQAMSGTVGPGTDLYALGCMLHEMLTGRRPFSAPTPLALLRQHADTAPEPVSVRRPEVAEELALLVDALLAKRPDARPRSAVEAYRTLLPLATGLDLPPGIRTVGTDPHPARMYAAVLARVHDPRRPPADRRPCAARETVGEKAGIPSADTSTHGARAASAPASRRPASTERRPDGRASNTPASDAPPPPPVSRNTLGRVRREAETLVGQARFSQAAELLSGVLDGAAAALGASDPDVFSARHELADVLFHGGDYRQAGPAYQRLADDIERQAGPADERVLYYRTQAATCHAILGWTDTALAELRSVLDIEHDCFGADDSRVLELRRQIALLLLGSGDNTQARGELVNLTRDLTRIRGPHHSDTRAARDLLTALTAQTSDVDGT